ncbi:MAG: filamentous hemagglutinin N-terminal domain-containing protein, partial [Rhodanobacter sp.]
MNKFSSTPQREPRHDVSKSRAPRGSLPLRKTWPISLCVGLAIGTIAFSGDALAGGPTGGVVVGGSGSITQSGNETVIKQISQRLALNWDTFNLKSNESVLFNQPSRSAVALNRILDQNPSQIFGKINSNGQVFLINTHGIIFGATAQMNVGGLMASTLDLTPKDFLAGNYTLNVAGAGAGIVNHGLIQAASGGSISLIGGSVLNDGVIVANYGTINLDGADHAVLDFDGDGLINIQITGELKKRLDAREAAVTNKGTLQADGGTVVLQASAAKDLFTDLVNNSGVIDASGISTAGGVVRLVGNGGNVENSGSINVSGVLGGSVQMLSDQGVSVTGSINASGIWGGGSIRVGGGEQGEGLPVAATTYIGHDATLSADATHLGNGGSVVVWGRDTQVAGSISARGGARGGNGGFIETSGDHVHISDGIRINTLAPNGRTGNWLIDPHDFTISATGDMTGTALGTSLGTSDITINSSSGANGTAGDINVDQQVTWGAHTLTLSAAHSININAQLNGTGTSALVLNSFFANGSDLAQAGGTINIKKNITTGGDQTYNGTVTLGGNATIASLNNGAIDFTSTVDGAHKLVINTGGLTTFGSVVGGTTALASLTTDAAGTTSLNGNVSTTGAQTYNDALTLGADSTLASSAGGAIDFASTVDGAFNLTVNTSGLTTFGDAVGSTTALTSLTTDAAGTTSLNGNVSTTGAQTYNDA